MNEKFRPMIYAQVRIMNHSNMKGVRSTRKVPVLIDSGASITILPESLSPALEKAGPYEEARAIVHTANGSREDRAIKNVSVCVSKVCSKGDAIVSGAGPGMIMIGSDFLARGKCTVDYKSKLLKCNGRTIRFRMEE